CARTGRGVLGDRMLGCRGPSTHRREPDDNERDEDDGDDEPGDHWLPPYPAARRRALRLPWRRPEPGLIRREGGRNVASPWRGCARTARRRHKTPSEAR